MMWLTVVLYLQIPVDLPKTRYFLSVRGLQGVRFSGRKVLKYENNAFKIFIQTDKSVYDFSQAGKTELLRNNTKLNIIISLDLFSVSLCILIICCLLNLLLINMVFRISYDIVMLSAFTL